MEDSTFGSYRPQGVFEGTVRYKEKLPTKSFKHLIAFYNQCVFDDKSTSSRFTAIPSGCTDLKFHCHPKKPSVFVCGSKKRNGLTNLPCDNYDLFGIRFWPGQFFKLFPYHSEAFTNIEVDLHSVSYHEIHKVADQILEAPAFNDRIKIWENFMINWLAQLTATPTWIDSTINLILNQKGNMNIAGLSKKIGYTDRHIRREFNRVVGMSPKLFSRIIKFQNVLTELQGSSENCMVDVSLEYGYHDQAHFIHEFKNFYGKTPTAILPHPRKRVNAIGR